MRSAPQGSLFGDGRTPAQIAAEAGLVKAVRSLLAALADPDATTLDAESALVSALGVYDLAHPSPAASRDPGTRSEET